MAERYPKDRFDEIPEDLARTGAHRAPPPPGRGWIAFAWAALASGILVVIGLLVIAQLNSQVNFELPDLAGQSASPSASASAAPAESATPLPTDEPDEVVTDPSTIDFDEISITMLNGTSTAGLAAEAGDYLEEQGWVVETRTNASENDVPTSAVYYYDEVNAGIARGVAEQLGVAAVQQSAAFPGASVTVVLGADFELPS